MRENEDSENTMQNKENVRKSTYFELLMVDNV